MSLPGREPAEIPRPVASARHTAIVLLVVAAVTVLAALRARQPEARAPGRSHVGQYLLMIASEWLLVLLVQRGVRGRGVTLRALVTQGASWTAAAGRALALAGLVWVSTFVLVGVLATAAGLRDLESARRTLALVAPHGPLEIALWIVLSASAGICEEIAFRGYLQRQAIALTRRPALGIALAALTFGAAHAYQGWRSCVAIAAYGLVLGIAAQRLRDLRPGIIAHAAQDTMSGLVGALMRH